MNATALLSTAPQEITREIYFNAGNSKIVVYILLGLSFSFFFMTLARRIRLWRKGKGEMRTDRLIHRIMMLFKYVIFQKKVIKEKGPGVIHSLIFFGFLGLFLVTATITIQEDVTWLFFDHRFLKGTPYLIWSLCGDVFGMALFLGLVFATIRRYINRPKRLDTRGVDTFMLALLMVIVLTGFAAEAVRIVITGFPAFEIYSPIGFFLAKSLPDMSSSALKWIHYSNWLFHVVSSFLFIALLATGKVGHVIISTLNIFFMNLENESAERKFTLPLIDPKEFETAESFGVSRVEEFTWKHLMDSDACTRCGRCQDNCPAWLTEKPLSPKKIIIDVKSNMEQRIPLLLKGKNTESLDTSSLIGDSVKEEEFWSCTNCGACMEACPVMIEHIPKIIDLRRYKVLMEGEMAPELQTTFMNLENNFNPYGFAFAERGDWLASEEGVKVSMMAKNSDVEYLYFVGSAASYDKKNQKVAIAFVKIMEKAGISIGILGPEEADSGDAALRGGNEYLFQALAAQNMETFMTYGVKKIICTCPHDYNVLKKEYKKFAALGITSDGSPLEYDFEVFHHTEILAKLIRDKKISLTDKIKETVTYHDSCFLGRYNEIYAAPRYILKSIPGIKLVEMSRHHGESFCCGAGGGRMFIEEHLGNRINHFRTRDAEATGASRIITACPFCMTMLTDGPAELGIDTLETEDIAKLVLRVMN